MFSRLLRYLIFCCCLILPALPASAQQYVWTKAIGGLGSDHGKAIVQDNAGNIYTTGYFAGTVDFDPGPGTDNHTATSSGIFLTRIEADGSYGWTVTFATESGASGSGQGLALDSSGNIVVSGYFTGTADFDPGVGTFPLSAAGFSSDAFVAKFSSAGSFIWAGMFSGNSSVYAYGVTVDQSDNILVSGSLSGTVDFDPSPAVNNQTGSFGSSAYLVKLTNSGSYLWAIVLSGTSSVFNSSIAVDSNGDSYVTGMFNGTADFDPSPATASFVAGGYDIYLAHYDSNGTYLWAKTFGNPAGTDNGMALAIDSNDDILIVGYFSGTADFNPDAGVDSRTSSGGYDQFISKFDTSGTYLWSRTVGSAGTDMARGISLDSQDNILLLGTINGVADINPDAGTFTAGELTKDSGSLVSLTPTGNFRWATSTPSDSYPTGISTSSSSVAITGYFTNLHDFNPQAGVDRLKSAGDTSDIFISNFTNFADAPSGAPLIDFVLDGTETNNTQPSVSGTANPADNIEIFAGGISQGTTVADGLGNWSFSFPTPLAEGSYIITATATDAGLNTYGPSIPIRLLIDLTAPATPMISSPADTFSTAHDWIKFSGSAEANSTVELFHNGVSLSTTEVDSQGTWEKLLQVPSGLGNVHAVCHDLAGNSSANSSIVQIFIDDPLTFSSAKSWGNVGGTTNVIAIDTDSLGNTYVAGNYSATIDFDPGVGVSNRTANANSDFYLSKFAADGSYLWTKSVGGSWNDNVTGMKIDSADNVVLVGDYRGTVDFNPDAGVDNHTSISYSVFVMKINADSSYGWARTVTSANYIITGSVDVGPDDEIVTTGYFYASTDFDPTAGTDTHSPAGLTDIYVSKLNSNGSYAWTKSFLGSGWDYGNGVTVDHLGNIYATGSFRFTQDFISGAGTDIIAANNTDVYLTKLASDGSYQWTKTFGGDDEEVGFRLTKNAAGDIFIAGHFQGTVDFNPGPGEDIHTAIPRGLQQDNLFVSKYNSDGSYAWTITLEGAFDGYYYWSYLLDLTYDNNSGVILTGTVDSPITVHDISSAIETPSGSKFGFATKIYEDGRHAWTKVISSDFAPGVSYAYLYSAAIDNTGNLLLGGTFGNGEFDLNPSYAIDMVTAGNSMASFLIRLDQDTSAPATPSIVSPTESALLSSTTPTISGTAEPNALVTATIDGSLTASTTTNALGNWSLSSPPLAEGAHSVTAIARDHSLNLSGISAARAFTLDLTPPSAPVISTPTDGLSTLNTQLLLSGSAEDQSTVTIFENAVSVYSGTATGGNWSASRTLTPGTYSYFARTMDVAGNLSADSAVVTVTIIPDLCPSDPLKSAPGICGCGVTEDVGDNDLDGTVNCLDNTPNGGNSGGNSGGSSNSYSLSGQIRLSNLSASALAGVTVSAGGITTITDTGGNYSLAGVPSGSQTVIASLNGYRFSPEQSRHTVTSNINDLNFTATPALSNPSYAFWNGYLGMINVLEMMNTGSTPLTLNLSVYGLSGEGQTLSRSWTIPALTQRDIIINDLPGFAPDTYGMLKLTASHNNFDGRISLYHPDTSGEVDSLYGFAYSDALRNSNQGQTAVMYNSYHPGTNIFDEANTVYNWLTIGNLSSIPQEFTVRRYNISGELVHEARVVVPALGRRDIDGGHINPGPNNVGTNIIIPDNNSAAYLANLVRYAEGSNFNAFDYAISLPATTGAERSINAPISSAAENYVEVANILGEEVELQLTFHDAEGYHIANSHISLPAYSQRHFPTLGLLSSEVHSGYVSLAADTPGSLIAQSVFYHREFSNRSIQTAYATTAREPFGDVLFTTYNSFLAMKNDLRLINIQDSETSLSYTLPEASLIGADAAELTVTLPANGASEVSLSAEKTRGDSYGLVRLRTSNNGVILAEMLRLRQLTSGKREFGIVTPAR